jgi:epoxyqueuosine reductase
MHASMHWMARGVDLRADPSRLLPGCQSVVSVAMNYWPGAEAAETPAGGAKVALYARGRDYHKVLGRKLRELASWIEEASGHPARSFVDTGPVLERAWAQASGLGWIGKNANLLTRSMGSWVLLGEILAVAPLDADRGPHEDFCGTCTACIQACPTSAIVAPGVVDSGRCISYWTIEHRGPIPEPLQQGIGDWIFGCDDCQSVCPWNRSFARAVPAERFSRREDLRGLDPREMLEIEEPAFRQRFSGTALMRAGWEGMRRNARAVVAGRRGW